MSRVPSWPLRTAAGAAAAAVLLGIPLEAAGLSRGARALSTEQGLSALELDEGLAPASLTVTKLREFAHQGKPWTQGLEFRSDGTLLETVGNYPSGTGSSLRVLSAADGSVISTTSEGLQLPRFVEGITWLGNRWVASTYEDKVALEYDQDLRLLSTRRFPWVGWGLTHDPRARLLLATNGTEHLAYLDPQTFDAVSSKAVMCYGKPVHGLNELEMVPDLLGRGPALLGNVINTRLVLAIDPKTARCVGVFHLEGLEPQEDGESFGLHVANGIAYNRQTGTLIVTGKNWASMFEVSLAEGGGRAALDMLRKHLQVQGPVSLSQLTVEVGASAAMPDHGQPE